MAEFLVMPAIVMGLAIGLYEAILVHRDVKVARHRLGHTLHAVGFAMIAVFATMNVNWLLATFSFLQAIPIVSNPLILQIVIGVIAMIKIHGASAAIKTTVGGATVGLKETWTHSFIIGALIVAAPYVWPLIAPIMPSWLQA